MDKNYNEFEGSLQRSLHQPINPNQAIWFG
jgi:hypothetical protein